MNSKIKKLRLAVGASGEGTCLQSVIDNYQSSTYDFEVACVFSDEPECAALLRAERHGIPKLAVPIQKITEIAGMKKSERNLLQRVLHEERLLNGFGKQRGLLSYDPDYVVLLGYERVVTQHFLDAFPNKVLNTHPAPLEFQGVGGYKWALGEHEESVRRNEWTCVTFHFVDALVDHGPIILQTPIVIDPKWNEKELSDAGKTREYQQISQCLQWLAEEKITINKENEIEIKCIDKQKIDYMIKEFEGEDKTKRYEFDLGSDEHYDVVQIKKEGKLIDPELTGYAIPKNTPNNIEFTYLYQKIAELRKQGFEIKFRFHGMNIHPVCMRKDLHKKSEGK